MPLNPTDIITGPITAQAFGADGILRHEGQVIFVPFAVVGDEVEVTILSTKKNFAHGKITRIITESPDRITPRCPHFGVCGGCQLQSSNYEYQVSLKHSFVKDALQRIGGINVTVSPISPSLKSYEYRRHVRLHFDGLTLGYKSFWNPQKIVQIRTCPIFFDDETLFQKLTEIMKGLDQRGELILHKTEDNRLIAGLILQTSALKLRAQMESLFKDPTWQGVFVRALDGEFAIKDCSLRSNILGLNIEYSPKAFMQAHPEESAKLYQDLLDKVLFLKPAKVLDLYCGIGVTALLMKKHGIDVTAVELNPEAIAMAKHNEQNNYLSGIDWQVSDVEQALPHLLKKQKPDVVLLNPPRTGLSAGVKTAIMKAKPKNLLYVSCMPATLSRDIKEFLSVGYHVTSCQPYDLFPQTTHVETLLQLSL